MSTSSRIEQIQRDIASLEKEKADASKKESDKTAEIERVRKSITPRTSPSLVKSKQSQIERANGEIAKARKKYADAQGKIAKKQKELATLTVTQNKEQTKLQQDLQKKYDTVVAELCLATEKNMAAINRTSLYAENSEGEEYDVFISHASEDKDSFVDEFYHELTEAGFKVWYDSACIKWGDSLRTKIDQGLANSRFGIVVLSKHFISKGWTQYELEGLFNIEMTNGKTILPIWHEISKAEVQKFSATLAGRLALSTTAYTTKEIVDKLKEITGK